MSYARVFFKELFMHRALGIYCYSLKDAHTYVYLNFIIQIRKLMDWMKDCVLGYKPSNHGIVKC